MSDRTHRQSSRGQGTESSTSASARDKKIFHDPRNPKYAGQRSSNTSGPADLDFGTGDLIKSMGLSSTHPLSHLKGGNDFVGQDRPKPTPVQQGKQNALQEGHASIAEASMTSVQQGKQKALQEGHASIAESSAPISNEEHLKRLNLRAAKIPAANPWPVEHVDMFEAYVALHTKRNGKVDWQTMAKKYLAFFNLYTVEIFSHRATAMRQDPSMLSNNWQKVKLDEFGNVV